MRARLAILATALLLAGCTHLDDGGGRGWYPSYGYQEVRERDRHADRSDRHHRYHDHDRHHGRHHDRDSGDRRRWHDHDRDHHGRDWRRRDHDDHGGRGRGGHHPRWRDHEDRKPHRHRHGG